ncbi:hypothetical protein GW17_00011140, partial [Ensete ventricosum]
RNRAASAVVERSPLLAAEEWKPQDRDRAQSEFPPLPPPPGSDRDGAVAEPPRRRPDGLVESSLRVGINESCSEIDWEAQDRSTRLIQERALSSSFSRSVEGFCTKAHPIHIQALTSAAVKKGGLYKSDIGSLYKYKNTHVNVKVDTDANISATLIISEILPSTKAIASIKLPDYNSGKLVVQYLHHHASLSSVMALKKSPVVELSGTVGAQGLAFGAEAGFDAASGAVTKYGAGVRLTKPEYDASVIM